jgi:hypothetical protein
MTLVWPMMLAPEERPTGLKTACNDEVLALCIGSSAVMLDWRCREMFDVPVTAGAKGRCGS